MERERRRAPRYQFIAPAELVEETSGARTNLWVSDLGSQGCSLRVANPLRAGSVFTLKIGADPRELFRAKTVVIYASTAHAGLMFSEIPPTSSAILEKWLASAKFPKRASANRPELP